MAVRAVSHIAVGVSDMDASLRFYRDLLGLDVTADLMEEFTEGSEARPVKRRAVYLRWTTGSHRYRRGVCMQYGAARSAAVCRGGREELR